MVELLVYFGAAAVVLIASVVSIRIAKLFPRLGIVAGVALIGASCYAGYSAWQIALQLQLAGVLLFFIVALFPLLLTIALGVQMMHVGIRILRGEDPDAVEEDLFNRIKRNLRGNRSRERPS